jgi:hypothetical protein
MEWVGEPVGAVLVNLSTAVIGLGYSQSGLRTLTLTTSDEVPLIAKWLDETGAVQTSQLAPPVVWVADRVLVAGSWRVTNYCTGQVGSDTLPPQLLDVLVADNGLPYAELPLTNSDFWQVKAAWIRVFEDGDGLRVFQWIEPATTLLLWYDVSEEKPALVTEAIPADVAKPLGNAGDGFDWVIPLTDIPHP